MCRETIEPLSIDKQRVRALGKTYYLPRNASPKLRQQIQSAIDEGTTLDVELLRHYLIVRAYPDGAPPKIAMNKSTQATVERAAFFSLGGYIWICTRCGTKVSATIEPRFCNNCQRR